jgi:two-component system, NarL family, nitrate/nitrite response regulator NarL
METALLVTSDESIRSRMVDALGRFAVAARSLAGDAADPAAELRRAQLCFYDLGSHRGESVAELVALVEAWPAVRFLALTAVPDAKEGLRLLAGGVRGYCNRWMSPAVVEVVTRTVLAGGVWAGQEVTARLLEQALARPQARAPGLGHLTAREREVAEAVAIGRSNKVIAAETGISERTVKAHLNAIYRKTAVRSRVQLALLLRAGDLATRRAAQG